MMPIIGHKKAYKVINIDYWPSVEFIWRNNGQVFVLVNTTRNEADIHEPLSLVLEGRFQSHSKTMYLLHVHPAQYLSTVQ